MYDIPAKQIAAGNVGGVQTGELSGKGNIATLGELLV
jgi:hypothetical protein